MTTTAILGGSFDPVHAGHLAIARLAIERLGMDEVLLVPAARPPHKPGRRLTDGYHRHAMLVLATLGEPRLRVSTEELTRAGRSYTIDTLERLRRAGGRRRWFFLAGSDAFVEIDSWKNARLVLDRIEFIVFPRQGAGAAALRRRLPAWVTRRLVEHTEADLPLAAPAKERSAGPRVHWVPLRAPAVSSSEVRRRAGRGENLDGLVPELVGHYIAQYRLYRRGKGAAA